MSGEIHNTRTTVAVTDGTLTLDNFKELTTGRNVNQGTLKVVREGGQITALKCSKHHIWRTVHNPSVSLTDADNLKNELTGVLDRELRGIFDKEEFKNLPQSRLAGLEKKRQAILKGFEKLMENDIQREDPKTKKKMMTAGVQRTTIKVIIDYVDKLKGLSADKLCEYDTKALGRLLKGKDATGIQNDEAALHSVRTERAKAFSNALTAVNTADLNNLKQVGNAFLRDCYPKIAKAAAGRGGVPQTLTSILEKFTNDNLTKDEFVTLSSDLRNAVLDEDALYGQLLDYGMTDFEGKKTIKEFREKAQKAIADYFTKSDKGGLDELNATLDGNGIKNICFDEKGNLAFSEGVSDKTIREDFAKLIGAVALKKDAQKLNKALGGDLAKEAINQKLNNFAASLKPEEKDTTETVAKNSSKETGNQGEGGKVEGKKSKPTHTVDQGTVDRLRKEGKTQVSEPLIPSEEDEKISDKVEEQQVASPKEVGADTKPKPVAPQPAAAQPAKRLVVGKSLPHVITGNKISEAEQKAALEYMHSKDEELIKLLNSTSVQGTKVTLASKFMLKCFNDMQFRRNSAIAAKVLGLGIVTKADIATGKVNKKGLSALDKLDRQKFVTEYGSTDAVAAKYKEMYPRARVCAQDFADNTLTFGGIFKGWCTQEEVLLRQVGLATFGPLFDSELTEPGNERDKYVYSRDEKTGRTKVMPAEGYILVGRQDRVNNIPLENALDMCYLVSCAPSFPKSSSSYDPHNNAQCAVATYKKAKGVEPDGAHYENGVQMLSRVWKLKFTADIRNKMQKILIFTNEIDLFNHKPEKRDALLNKLAAAIEKGSYDKILAKIDADGGGYDQSLQSRFDGWVKMCKAAEIDYLIAGKIGCGVFGNNPQKIARAFARAWVKYGKGDFIFCQYNKDSDDYKLFQAAFEEAQQQRVKLLEEDGYEAKEIVSALRQGGYSDPEVEQLLRNAGHKDREIKKLLAK